MIGRFEGGGRGKILEKSEDTKNPTEKPVGMHPLGSEEAVKNLLRVKDLRGKLGRNDGETND